MTVVHAGRDGFYRWSVGEGASLQVSHDGQRCDVVGWHGSGCAFAAEATHFGFVQAGSGQLHGAAGRFPLQSGMYFALPGLGSVQGDCCGLVVSLYGASGLFQLGGPVEERGRLHYIDGCSDTLLLSPVVRGDACLNLLVIPPQTCQTAHTHPSLRAGIIAAGHGLCRLNSRDVPLQPGDLFVIDPETLHSFHTEGESLTVIAFHPDSDFGPHRDDHPMVNRTLVEGVSAARLSLAERRIEGHAP